MPKRKCHKGSLACPKCSPIAEYFGIRKPAAKSLTKSRSKTEPDKKREAKKRGDYYESD